MNRLLTLILVSSGLALSSLAGVEKHDVFVSGKDGYHTYRIPAVIKAANGDLLAFCEGRKNNGGDAGDIDLLLKRSSDGGKTWGPQAVLWDDGENTCGNPCPVLDASTGTLWLLLTHNPGILKEEAIRKKIVAGTRTVWVARSDDNGKSWTKPLEITSTSKLPGWGWYATGPGVGIQIQSGPKAGRLLIPCDHSYAPEGEKKLYGVHALVSDDHGRTWKVGGQIRPLVNECQAVELYDGRGTLLMDMRSYAGRGCRDQSVSEDGGDTWTQPQPATALVEPICQASILRWETLGAGKPGLMIFSNPAHTKKRLRMTVKASDDDARSWTRSLLLHEGPSAYSCLVALDAKTAGCLYENGDKRAYERITFATFSEQDLTRSTP